MKTAKDNIEECVREIIKNAEYIDTELNDVDELMEDRDAWKIKAEEWEEKYISTLRDYGNAEDKIGELQKEVEELTYQLNNK